VQGAIVRLGSRAGENIAQVACASVPNKCLCLGRPVGQPRPLSLLAEGWVRWIVPRF